MAEDFDRMVKETSFHFKKGLFNRVIFKTGDFYCELRVDVAMINGGFLQ